MRSKDNKLVIEPLVLAQLIIIIHSPFITPFLILAFLCNPLLLFSRKAQLLDIAGRAFSAPTLASIAEAMVVVLVAHWKTGCTNVGDLVDDPS